MEKRFSGKIIVVTGGCRGIGKAIVERFAKEDAKVYVLDYIIPNNYEVFIEDKEITSFVKCIQSDVTQDESVQNAIDNIIDESQKIDVLINNAGVTRDNLILRMTEEQWDTVINTNLKGAFICSKAVCRSMMSQRSGRIINIGSIVGTTGNAGQTNYSASKAGIAGFTKSLAKELASRNILVNCVAPGYVRSSMTEKLSNEQRQQFLENIPLKRAAEPSDIANVVAFLASDDSSYITGQVIHVDGGLAM